MIRSPTAPSAASAARAADVVAAPPPMTADANTPEGLSLKRWSRRKLEAARAKAAPAIPAAPSSPAVASAPAAASVPMDAAQPASVPAPAETLPPIESLTIDSDFAAFLQPKVDETLKRLALKQLFRDPRFNVMDGLDVYIDDYSKPDPISPDIVRQMVQGRYIFDPPQTRINAQGHVEDVPPEEAALDRPADAAAVAADTPPQPSSADAAAAAAPLQPSTAEAPAAAESASPAPPESAVDPAAASDPKMPEPRAR